MISLILLIDEYVVAGIPLVLHSAVSYSHDAMTNHASDFLPLIFLAKHTKPVQEGLTLQHRSLYVLFKRLTV